MISFALCLLVKRNVATGGGIFDAISAINTSSITPGPLGISETNPSAEAPYLIASLASSKEAIQHILTLTRFFNYISQS